MPINFNIYMPGIKSKEDQKEYLNELLSVSTHTSDVDVTVADRIMLLSTCSNMDTNERIILAGRIADEEFEDDFTSD